MKESTMTNKANFGFLPKKSKGVAIRMQPSLRRKGGWGLIIVSGNWLLTFARFVWKRAAALIMMLSKTGTVSNKVLLSLTM